MEELKEQIEEYLRKLSLNWDEYVQGLIKNPISYQVAIDYLLTLFQNWLKKELDGLNIVIVGPLIWDDDGEVLDSNLSHIGRTIAQAQLDAVKEHFEAL